MQEEWRGGSSVKRLDALPTELGLFPHLRGNSKPSLAPVPGDPRPSSNSSFTWNTYIFAGKTYTNNIKVKFKSQKHYLLKSYITGYLPPRRKAELSLTTGSDPFSMD